MDHPFISGVASCRDCPAAVVPIRHPHPHPQPPAPAHRPVPCIASTQRHDVQRGLALLVSWPMKRIILIQPDLALLCILPCGRLSGFTYDVGYKARVGGQTDRRGREGRGSIDTGGPAKHSAALRSAHGDRPVVACEQYSTVRFKESCKTTPTWRRVKRTLRSPLSQAVCCCAMAE